MKKITSALYEAHKNKCLPVITAHSGCEKTPPNSIEHILQALSSGAEMFEIDIREKNGGYYLSHDEREDYSDCPTVDECFRLAASNDAICINCDVKTFGLTGAVMKIAEKYGIASRIVFTGNISDEELPALNETEGDWWLSLWPSHDEKGELKAAAERYEAWNREYTIVNMHHRMVDDEYHALAKKLGCPLSVWTVDKEEDIRRMMALGVWNITTREPKLALSIRKELFGE